MAKISKGVILSQASQIKSDYSFALIKATTDNKNLVQDASSAELKVNALVDYSKDSQWDPKKLTNLGFPAGCFLIVDLRGQTAKAVDLVSSLTLVRQYGYQVGVIDDLNTLDDIHMLKTNQVYLINSGKTNDDQDASLSGDEITDNGGKLAVGISVKWQRDYTNVDVSGDHAGYVGMGQDTLLKGGNAFGYSTNGRDFNAVITPKGLIFRRPDAERMWRLLRPKERDDIDSTVSDRVKKEVDSATAEIPAAVSAANSAVSVAESAIAASKVNSDAIVAQSEAISEAKAAMDSATAEIQQTAANAASDAAKIRADVAQVQSEVDTAKAANSASVEALKSDIGAAKQDLSDVHDSLDKAQSAIEQNQKLINDNVAKITSDVSATKQDLATVHDSLTKAQATAEQNQKAIDKSIAQINDSVASTNQDLAGVRKDLTQAQSDITANQKSINDNVAQINSDIEQDRKDIASAQQANADTAKQLDTYSKQAVEQGKTIKSIQDKQDGFTATIADVQGSVSQVSDKVDGLSASLKDTQGNVASVKAQADQLSATLTDHAKSIATLTASAKELSSTLEDADGRLSKVEQTAKTNSSTLSDVQGDLSQVKQDATTLTATLKDAQGNISTLQQKADSVSAQLASAQGDIATLQTGVDGVKATLASHDKSIHTLQLDSKSLKDSMADAQGDISTLSKTATSLDSEMKDHAGRLSKVEQSAATQATTLSDLQGNLSQVKQQADGLVTTLKDAQGNITQIQQKADGTLAQLKSAQGDIASLQTDVTGIKATLVSHEGDIHTLQADSKTLKDDMQDAQGNISSLQKSSTKLDSEMSSQDGRLSKVEQTAKEHTSTISDLGDKLSNLKVGGRNLLHGTSDQWRTLTGSGWLSSSTASDMYTSVADYHGGDQFTYSAIITNPSTVSVRLVLYCYGANRQGKIKTVLGPSVGPGAGAMAVSTTIAMDSQTWFLRSNIETIDGKAPQISVQVKEEKLEAGNTATAWTPNPEDMATLTQVKQTADGIETTLKSAQGDIDQIKQTAKGTSEQLADVQGNVTNIQKDVNGLKQTTADNAGNIHTLQSDSKSLHDSMQDAQGDISTLKKTSTDVVSELKDHAGRISKTEQTASTLVNEFADQQGHLNRVEQTATGTQQTVANQQGQINNIKTDAAGIHETLTGQGNQIANINVTLSGLNSKYEGVSGDLGKLKDQTNWKIVTGVLDANQYTKTARIFYQDFQDKNTPVTGWFYLIVDAPSTSRITQTLIKDNSTDTWTRVYNGSWKAWTKGATNLDITALSNRIATNSTQITQNKQAIALKADQSTVSNLSGQVSQAQAQLKVQADQISSKVSSTDFKTLNDKVNGMQIGGRNVLRNTDPKQIDKIESDSTWVLGSGGNGSARTISLPNTFSAKQGFEIYGNAAGNRDFTQRPIHWTKNRYIFSIYARIADGSTVKSVDMLTRAYSNQVNRAVFENHHNLTSSSWERVVLPIDASSFYTQSGVSMAFGLAGPGSIDFAQPMLEIATTPSMWSPAPEDAITAIQKNSTAIDQTNKQISLKADQTEVDKVKQTASQNSSRLDVMAGQIQSKVTSTDVNNIVDKKGYATTSTVQSLITQKAGTINESITNLTSEMNTRNGVNLLKGTKDFSGSWHNAGSTNYWHTENWIDPNGNHSVKSDSLSWCGYYQPIYLDTGDYTFSGYYYSEGGKPVYFYVKPNSGDNLVEASYTSNLDSTPNGWRWFVVHFKVTKAGNAAVRLESGQNQVLHIASYKLERGTVTKPVWTPAPSDNATVTQVQEITASIDGIQSTVANKADKSQITQLSNMIQSKVSSSDFNNLRKAVDLQKLVSADINNMKTNGHYFVRNLANNPVGGWVYVDITGNGSDRIRQDVYQDSGNQHKYRRWFGNYWTNWEEGATYTEITQLQDAINLRVKSGDLLSQINIQAGQTLIQSKKLYLADDSVIFSNKAFIPSAAIVNLDASKLTFYGADGTYATMGSSVSQYDADKLKSTINLQYNGGVEVHSSNQLGSILTMHDDTIRLAVKSQVYGSGSGQALNQQYSGVWASSNYVLMNSVDSEGNTTGISIGSGGNVNGQYRFVLYDDSKSNVPSYGVKINTQRFDLDAGSTSLYMGPTRTEIRANDYTTLHGNDKSWLEGGHAQIYLHDGVVEMHNLVDGSAAGLHMTVQGWATFSGYVEAMGWTTKSTLSSKTRIEPLNTSDALDKITSTDLTTYQYKDEVSAGSTKRHAGIIIDDVHDVAQYSTPDAFISENRQGRSDADIIGYLMGAVQELKKQLDKVKEQVNNG